MPKSKVVWINSYQICPLPPWSVLHCVSSRFHAHTCWDILKPYLMALVHPLVFRLWQPGLLYGVSLSLLWAKPTQHKVAVSCECAQTICDGLDAREQSPMLFYLVMQTCPVPLLPLDVSSSWTSVPLSMENLFCSFSRCVLEPAGSIAGYPELVKFFSFHTATT